MNSSAYGLGFALLLLTACSHEEVSVAPAPPSADIRIFTRGIAANNNAAQLFIWEEEAYGSFLKDELPDGIRPYFQQTMPDVINTYMYDFEKRSGTPYNTYFGYPDVTGWLYASGIAPAEAFATPITGGYDVIPVEETCRDGQTDFTASNNDGTSKGRFTNPFVYELGERIGPKFDEIIDDPEVVAKVNEDRELKFRHLTAAISFLGARSDKMENKIGIANVKVEIVNDRQPQNRKLAVPTSLKRFYLLNDKAKEDEPAGAWTYIANPADEYVPEKLEATVPGVIVMDEEKELVTFYTHTAGLEYGAEEGRFNPFVIDMDDRTVTPSLTINVEADLFLVQDPNEVRHKRWENLEITNWAVGEGAYGTGDRFLPGHRYRVVIEFNLTSIGLRAELIPWIEMGPYYFPVWGQK